MLASIVVALLLAAPGTGGNVERWRAEREARLRADDGWLSLTGLFWLQQGENRIGSAPGSRVELPSGFPAAAGVLIRRGNAVHLRPVAGADVLLNGKKTGGADLRTDKTSSPDILQVGRLRLHLIERGSKLGVRMKDPRSAARVHFRGLQWFPVKDEWKVRARFVSQPKKMFFDAQAGDRQEYMSPGYVEWERNGQTLRLTPVTEDGQLFFVFRDATSGKSTYAAARFLDTDPPKDGFVVLDFNKAYNPPCVFTPYATCPLPPPENRLKVAVEAGERMYSGHDESR